MTTEAKFEIGQKIWTILDGKARELPITSIEIKVSESSTIVKYYLNSGTENNYQCEIIRENLCFKSREDLIENL